METKQIRFGKQKVKYSFGPYNKWNDKEQWIRLTEGCPNNCPYCYEPQEYKVFDIPTIRRNNVKIMDMNLLAKPEAFDIIRQLGEFKSDGKVIYYELICGIDYRFLTPEISVALKRSRFRNLRIAWDWLFKDQRKIKKAIEMLRRAGYTNKNDNITIFMICNWKIPYEENCKKLDLCKIWRVRVSDCYFDNQTSPNIIPIHWTSEQIKKFRKKVRTHNLMINFHIDPSVKE